MRQAFYMIFCCTAPGILFFFIQHGVKFRPDGNRGGFTVLCSCPHGPWIWIAVHASSSIQRRSASGEEASSFPNELRPTDHCELREKSQHPFHMTPSCSILNSNGRLLIDDRDLNVAVMSMYSRTNAVSYEQHCSELLTILS